jgi:mRNA interferase MazF
VKRGDILLCDLGNPIGHEQGKVRPVLVVSADPFHRSGLAVIAPLTRTHRQLFTSVEIEHPGLRETSYIQTDQLRTVSQLRFGRQVASADELVMHHVGRAIKRLLALT